MSIRVLLSSGMALALLLGGAAGAQTAQQSIEAALAGVIDIALTEGEVTVTGWDRAEVEVSGELGNGVDRLELTRDGERILVRVISASEAGAVGGFFEGETELYARVPRDSSLEITTVSADILVAGVAGSQSLRAVSGDIETEFWSGSIEAETVGGDLVVSGRAGSGNAVLTSVSGDIEVQGAFERLTASTGSGDIELDILDASIMDLNTTNGEIEVHATLADGATLEAETINGDVDLEVGQEGNLSLDIGTFSGQIENCFGVGVTASEDGAGSALQLAAGENAPRVRVRTLNGDIELCSS